MLRHVYEEGYTYIHSATPGPIGLAGLAAARILKLPVSGTYHTAIPQYAAYLTGDDAIEQLVWRYILWYYKQMEYVYVPSTDTGDSLVEKGVDADRIVLYPRGVDTESYHPGFARDYYQKKHQLNGKTRLLYVGRVSKEKNMPILADAFKRICRDRNDLQLIVVGDGPYLDEMKRDLSSCPALFTGYLTGSELASAYADADLFVFPSTTDTFGNVILEAQASGLPVLVTDTGGPRENILPEQTGKVVGGDSVSALVDGVMDLLNSPLKLRQMAREARLYAESRSFENAFLEHWRLYHRELDDEFPSLAKAS
jgi:glycosyltransferase involved in cell wall biosynthesis